MARRQRVSGDDAQIAFWQLLVYMKALCIMVLITTRGSRGALRVEPAACGSETLDAMAMHGAPSCAHVPAHMHRSVDFP